MMLRTHYAIAVFFILLFWPVIEHKLIFAIVALVATQLPDIDSRYSRIGRKKLARIFQWFTRHRGMIHSFTFLLSITFILILIFPVLGFGFFLGYGLHLLADSFTIDGIRPFYPSKIKSWGNIRTGRKLESLVLFLFVLLSVVLFFIRIF